MAGHRAHVWWCALCVGLAVGCGSPAATQQAARAQQPARAQPTAAKAQPGAPSRAAAGIWLSSLQMTSARAGWALRWTVSPQSKQAGYLVTRTADGARTWSDVTPPGAVARLEAAGATAVLDALGPDRAWLAVTIAAPGNPSPHLTLVFRTSNGGRTWTGSAPFRLPAPASLLSFAGSDDGWLLSSDGGEMGQDPVWLYRTTNAGRRWSLVAAPSRSGTGSNGLPAGCDKTGLFFATAETGWLSSACNSESPDVLQVTRDGGARWKPEALPALGEAFCSAGCAAYSSPQFFGRTGFAVIGDGSDAPHFLVSSDLGRSWAPQPLPPGAGAYPRITFFGRRDGVLVPAGPSGAIGRIFDTTEDGGTTWTAVREGKSFTANGTQFDFVTTRTGFAWVPGSDAVAGPPAMDETTDSGHTWRAFTPVQAVG